MNMMKVNTGLNVQGRRAARLRQKDELFDALCETYADLGQRIAELESASGTGDVKLHGLEQQRASCFDTIMFILDDANGSDSERTLH